MLERNSIKGTFIDVARGCDVVLKIVVPNLEPDCFRIDVPAIPISHGDNRRRNRSGSCRYGLLKVRCECRDATASRQGIADEGDALCSRHERTPQGCGDDADGDPAPAISWKRRAMV